MTARRPSLQSALLTLLLVTSAAPAPVRAEDRPVPAPERRIAQATGLPIDRTDGPSPFRIPSEGSPLTDEPADPREGIGEGADHVTDPSEIVPEVRYGEEDLPEPVRQTRRRLVEAARSGELTRMGDLIRAMPQPPALTTLQDGSDPVDILAAQSGDEEGREILAILLDILDAGWVRVGEGTSAERYVWPYFARTPVEQLSAPQMVELYRILTAVDFEEMRSAGAYVFYRVEIAPDGRWLVFQAGE